MKVIQALPPNIKKIYARFPHVRGAPVVFAYGDTIYNPGRDAVSDDVMAHEKVHQRQQAEHPGGVEGWWDQYLEDSDFRLDQELEAYGAQLRYYAPGRGKYKINQFLLRIATDLSTMYDLTPGIELSEAMNLIRAEANSV